MVLKSEEKSEISINFKGGGSFTKLPPVFSFNAESIFVSWKSSILEYNTGTGKFIHEYKDLSDNIIGFGCHIYNTHQCITACTRNGNVIVWKTLTHYKLFEKKLPITNVKSFHVIKSEDDDLKALISYINKKNVVKFTLVNLKEKTSKNYSIVLNSNQNCMVDISTDYFTIINQNVVYFVKFKTFDKYSKCSIQDNKNFTCVACHSSEEIVLTGDTLGRVIVWQNIFGKEKTQNVFHWHTLPVQTVCFSPSGTYFYSGGDECVLVKWQLDNVNDRRFVPRIASEIRQVVVSNNNALIAVGTKDNAVRIFNNTLNQTVLIQHLVLGKHYECGIVYDSRTRALVMNGNQGCVQFYSPWDMTLLYSVDMIGQNKITDERERTMINTEITKMAISKSGLWMASVEERRDDEYHNEIRLKFWKFDLTNQTFMLNTSIEYPHERSVNSIQFQPANTDENLRCVTVGNDEKFRIWQLEETTTINKKSLVWMCFGIGFYRELPCNSLSFSTDGSLMAISFKGFLTLWAPNVCELKCSLVHPIHKENLKYVQFGNGNKCHLLVAASSNQISVWNILSLCLVWTVPLNVNILVADPFSDHMAVFTTDRHVFVFKPDSSNPVYTSLQEEQLLKKHEKIITAAFVPTKNSNNTRLKWYERSNIYFIGSNNELYSIGSSDPLDEIPEFYLDTLDSDSGPSVRLPLKNTNTAAPSRPTKHLFEKDVAHKAIEKYLMGSTHTMLPIRFACQSLLKSLVFQKEIILSDKN